MAKSRTQLGIFVRLFAPFAVLVALAVLGLYWVDVVLDRRSAAEQSRATVTIAAAALLRTLHDAAADTLVLAESTNLQNYLFTGDPDALDRLAVQFAATLRNKPRYSRLRFVDWYGHEVVRVDFGGGRAAIAERDALEDLSGEPFVQAARPLPRGAVYVSRAAPEDGGEGSPPPALHLATPVYDRDSVPRGLLVASARTAALARVLPGRAPLGGNGVMLVNESGEWVSGQRPPDAAGGVPGTRFSASHPAAGRMIADAADGQFLGADGLYSFAAVRLERSPAGPPPAPGARMIAAEQLKVVTKVPLAALTAGASARLRMSALVGCALVLAWGLLSLRSARLRTEARTAAARARQFGEVLSQTSDLVLITDAEGTISYTNAAFSAVTGFGAEEVLGRNPRLLRSGQHGPEFYRRFWQTILSGKPFQGVFVNRTRSGVLYYEDKTVTPVADEHGTITHFVSTGKNITELLQTREHLSRLTYLAHHDPLTGLPNRTLFLDRLGHAMDHAERQGRLTALLFIDLDGFKEVNDRFGHQAGDRLLKTIAERLTEVVRKVDTVARMGGDEFTLVLEGLNYAADAERVAAKVLDTLVEPFHVDGERITVTASIGIAFHPFAEVDADTLVTQADTAMYQSKQLGRNRFCIYSPEIDFAGKPPAGPTSRSPGGRRA